MSTSVLSLPVGAIPPASSSSRPPTRRSAASTPSTVRRPRPALASGQASSSSAPRVIRNRASGRNTLLDHPLATWEMNEPSFRPMPVASSSRTTMATSTEASGPRSRTVMDVDQLPDPASIPALAMTPASASHRRSRSREIWATLGDLVTGKYSSPREEMEVDTLGGQTRAPSPVTLSPPPSLPHCTLTASFAHSDCNADLPPAFYPGQAIPTVVNFTLDRDSMLPHNLHPSLTMSLIGTLHTPRAPPRTIICVSVSLSEGMDLWIRDATSAYAAQAPDGCIMDPSIGLPGGNYCLPLTVQVPSTPRLPPSFAVPGGSFSVTYSLTISLMCDDPLRHGARALLAEVARPFDMMPETLPTRAPKLAPHSFFVRTEGGNDGGVVGVAKGLMRRPNARWTVQMSIPTTAYSPTSRIPLTMSLTPPPDQPNTVYQILIRLGLVRREHSSLVQPAPGESPSGPGALVNEEEISVRYGWIESADLSTITLQDIAMPLMPPLIAQTVGWQHGFSTMLSINPPSNAPTSVAPIQVSSSFYLNVTAAFMPVSSCSHMPQLQKHFGPLPAMGEFTSASPTCPDLLGLTHIRRTAANFPGTVKHWPIAIVVGSVAEPRGAMHSYRWNDLQLDRNAEGQATGGGRVVHGDGISCENGWMVPPPAYGEAIREAPYV